MSHRPHPTHFQAVFTEARWLRIPPTVHQLAARQFFVQAVPADAPRGAALPVCAITRITTYQDGTVDIVFAEVSSGVVFLIPLPDALPTPLSLADSPSSCPGTTDSPA